MYRQKNTTIGADRQEELSNANGDRKFLELEHCQFTTLRLRLYLRTIAILLHKQLVKTTITYNELGSSWGQQGNER